MPLATKPKLAAGDYGELVRTLRKVRKLPFAYIINSTYVTVCTFLKSGYSEKMVVVSFLPLPHPQVITKDSNVMVVALAGNIVKGLAIGLRKNFQPYSANIIGGILEKFKEKKVSVVTALKEAADAVYLCVSSHAA